MPSVYEVCYSEIYVTLYAGMLMVLRMHGAHTQRNTSRNGICGLFGAFCLATIRTNHITQYK